MIDPAEFAIKHSRTSDLISQITNENYDSVFGECKKDVEAHNYSEIINNILQNVSILIDKIPLFVRLCKDLTKDITVEDENENIIPTVTFRSELFKALFKSSSTFRQKIPHYFFLRELKKVKVFTIAEIGNRIAKIPISQSNQLFSVFCYFCTALQKYRKTTFTNTCEKINSFTTLDNSLQWYCSRFEQLAEDDFAGLNKLIIKGCEPDTIEYALKFDDPELLSVFMKQANFHVSATMKKIPFEICEFVQNKPHYVEFAAFFGSSKCVQLLLDSGSEPYQIAKFAVAGNHPNILKMCYDRGFSLQKTLRTAIQCKRYEYFGPCLEYLKNKDCCLDSTVKEDHFSNLEIRFTPIADDQEVPKELKMALNKCTLKMARINNVRGLEMCYRAGADFECKDVAECTPVIYAVSTNSIEALKYLIMRCVNVNNVDITGWSALHFAARSGTLEIIRELLEAPSIDLKIKTGTKKTALHIAAEAKQTDVYNILVEAGADEDAVDKNGNTAKKILLSPE